MEIKVKQVLWQLPVNDLKTIACVIRIIGVNLVWKTVWRRKDSVTEVGYRSETLKSCLGDQNFSQKEVLLDSTRANTHSAYHSSWIVWRNWCEQRNGDSLSPGIRTSSSN